MIRSIILALLIAILAVPAFAVEPDEMLKDPVLEARARELGKEIRCLVCQNQSIDDSDADLARDLRVLVRERLVAGDSDAEVEQYVVDRYGEYVLLKPTLTAKNLILWLTGPLLLIFGAIIAVIFLRRRASAQPASAELSKAEQDRLKKLLSD